MKNLKKRILSFLLVTAMLLTCIPVFATENETESLVGTTYSVDLSMEKSVSDNFRFAGFRKSDGKLVAVEDTARTAYGSHTGFYMSDGGPYVIYATEGASHGVESYDMLSRDAYMPAIIFTAPADGVYDIYFKGIKYQVTPDSFIDLFIKKIGEDTPIAVQKEICNANGAGMGVFELNGIALAKGEEIAVYSALSDKNTRNGGANFGVLAFDVTYVATEGGSAHGDYAEGATYSFIPDTDNKATDHFNLASVANDGTIGYLEYKSRRTSWDANYIAWWTYDGSKSVFCDTQGATKGTTLDMTPSPEYGSAIVFTAPVSGVYSFAASFTKLTIYNTNAGYKLEAIYDGNVIDEHTFANAPGSGWQDAKLEGTDITLEKGEQIILAAKHVSDGTNSPEITVRSVEFTLEEVLDRAEIKYVSDLDRYHTVDGPFFIGAMKHDDGTICPVETSPRALSWTNDPAYIGNYVVGTEVNVTQGTEGGASCRFDMYPKTDKGYSGLVGFTAPADGIFSIYAGFKFVGNGDAMRIVVMKDDGTVLQNVDLTVRNALYYADIDFIELEKGEQVLLKSDNGNWTTGNKNIGFMFYNVEAVYETENCPHDFSDDTVCDACGYVCEAHEWKDGECIICGTVCAHNWDNGACTTCGIAHEGHEWANENGTCTVCGKGHTHEGGAATCQKGAVCTTCGYEYTAKNTSAHVSDEFVYESLGNGKHEKLYACCGALAATEDCDCNADNGFTCEHCGYLDEDEKLEYTLGYNAEGAIANLFFGGNYEVNPVGPDAGALDSYLVAKPADDLGVTYAHFNLRFDNSIGMLVLRNHFVPTTDFKIYIDEVEVAPIVNGNTCYTETVFDFGALDEAISIRVEVGGESVTYEVSVYSYMAIALENTDDAKIIDALNALYDYNEYVKAN